MSRLILASASPRRRELLCELGFSLVVRPADVDESRLAGEEPTSYVLRLARMKAMAACERCGHLATGDALVAADTIVHLGTTTFGKPGDDADAARMLRTLSGATHQVSTGVCVMVATCDDGKANRGITREHAFVETTNVSFYDLADDEIAAYVASGEPRDKAGAYGVQATGRLLVRRIDGDYFNVVGLPVARVARALADLGFAGRADSEGDDATASLAFLLRRRGDRASIR